MGCDVACFKKTPDNGLGKRGEREEAINFLSSLLIWSRRWGLNTHSQPQRLFWGKKIGQMELSSWTHRNKRSSKETEQRGCWQRSWDCGSQTEGTSKDWCSPRHSCTDWFNCPGRYHLPFPTYDILARSNENTQRNLPKSSVISFEVFSDLFPWTFTTLSR